MHRAFQVLALALALGLLTFLACRAQSSAPPPTTNPAAAPGADAGADATAAPPPPPPEVYLPASKSGGAFLEHQQAPR
ncbi:MAG: hypothetical protein KA201_11490 [Kofleriaceae bacterium]|nr:hypothetical protein [Kofleriaceae bacterium]